jgi:hypothetical protein
MNPSLRMSDLDGAPSRRIWLPVSPLYASPSSRILLSDSPPPPRLRRERKAVQQMDRELCTAADYTVCIKGLHKTDDPAEMHR